MPHLSFGARTGRSQDCSSVQYSHVLFLCVNAKRTRAGAPIKCPSSFVARFKLVVVLEEGQGQMLGATVRCCGLPLTDSEIYRAIVVTPSGMCAWCCVATSGAGLFASGHRRDEGVGWLTGWEDLHNDVARGRERAIEMLEYGRTAWTCLSVACPLCFRVPGLG
jgi:hypothetical protein